LSTQETGTIVMASVALCMIVKGSDSEADHLKRCLTNISPYVDGMFINLNAKPGHKPSVKVRRIVEQFTENIIQTEWHDNFAEARNANLEQVPEQYTHILWLDADDTIDHPEKIKQLAEKSQSDAIFIDYLYEQDESGNPLVVHMVNRLFRNNGAFTWKGRIHETLTEKRAASKVATKDFMVIHHNVGERRVKNDERNIRMLKLQLEDEGSAPDPRTLYYLGCTYIDAGEPENAKELLSTYLQVSGWNQERCAAYTKLGRLYLQENNTFEAKKNFLLAIGEDPDNPEPQVEMGSLELEIREYQKARKWLEGVLKLDVGVTTLERNPMSYTFRTYLLLADVYMSLGGSYLDKAMEYARKALKYKKKDKDIKKYVKVIEQIVEDKNLLENILNIVKKLKKNKEDDKIKTLARSAPKQLEDNPLIIKLRDDPFTWPEKSIAIMCGDSADEEWGPWSLEKGIGGSEEAVIRLSKHLVTLDYKVTVFAKPMDNAGLIDGVMWRNFWEANFEDTYDIFVGWRMPGIFSQEIKARKKYLWLHDVIEAGELTPDRLANLDKVMVLSKYHRSLFPNVPEEKILLSANGIDPDDFEGVEVERDPHKVFYGSSHVRGLTYLYDIWPDVKKAVPDATLDVYYGRETYDAINAGNPERLKWMDDIQQKARELDGVTDHGKVSQTDIVRHAFESAIWAYPTLFPEISCITAMKNQAAGAIPVVSDFAALKETVQFGEKINLGKFTSKDIQHYKQRLIWWLQHPEEQEKIRPKMMEWSRKNNSWASVAKGWHDEFSS
jgi:glycosyltransferase involved in cell wall biosynthesis/Tfp pilus assembly protein PilF